MIIRKICFYCPLGIPVSKFMLAFNRKTPADEKAMKQNIRMYWRIDPESVNECTRCGICGSLCTQHLPTIERLKEISEIYKKKI